jgi:hypothetical protein
LVRGGVVVGLGAGDQCRYVFVFSDRATVEEGVPSSNKQACLSGGNKLKWKAVWLAKRRKGGRYETIVVWKDRGGEKTRVLNLPYQWNTRKGRESSQIHVARRVL